MGSLGSCDGMGLFLSWIVNPRTSESGGKVRRRSDSVRVWNAIVATSKCGLGLVAGGAPLKLRDILSSDDDLYMRASWSQDGRGQEGFSDQHWTRWLGNALQGNRRGVGSLFHWNLGTAKSGRWRLFAPGPGASSDSNKGKSFVTGIGGGREERSSNSADKDYPRGTLTALILGLNALIFFGQVASKGRLLLYGAKINALIDQGQWWRLLTPSVLHANIFHLLVNSYSLRSVGPTVESLAGPRRFLTVYSASAVTGTTLSYLCCSSPSVGASGAIFGLVGALAVFLVRHKDMMVGGKQSLQEVARVIAINMVLGFVSDGIDNWSHFGGLLGGAAVTWLLGPAYSFEEPGGRGQRELVDRPPISYLIPSRFRRSS